MDDWIYFKLVHKENKNVELIGCIDLCTIDDDEPDCEYMNNQGLWTQQRPDYWVVDGVNCYWEMESLKEVEVYEADMIPQYLVTASEIAMETSSLRVFRKEFKDAFLYISYDPDFDGEITELL